MSEDAHPSPGLWVLEWSQKTNNPHIQPLAMTLGMNSTRFVLDSPAPGDYIPIAIGSQDAMGKQADFIREALIAREQTRAQSREVSHG